MGPEILAARSAIDTGAKTIISGHFGPNAFSILKATGIEMFLIPDGESLSAREVLDRFRSGQLVRVDHP